MVGEWFLGKQEMIIASLQLEMFMQFLFCEIILNLTKLPIYDTFK